MKTYDVELIKAAIKAGQKTYLSPRICKKNYHPQRFVRRGTCVQCSKEQGSFYHKKNKGKYKEYDLKRKYNITPQQFNEMILSQNNRCKLCENKLISVKLTHVDHCHITKKIRGVLCNKCNQGIGLLLHSPNLLRKAALYCEEI